MKENNYARILFVEDDPNGQELVMDTLQKNERINRIYVVRDGSEVQGFIFAQGKYDNRKIEVSPKVVLPDLKLLRVDGLQDLRQRKKDAWTKNSAIGNRYFSRF